MKNIGDSFKIPVTFALVFWCLELLKWVQIDLTVWGIYPRTQHGLWGILFAPLLHGSIPHLVSNTPTFILLNASILFFYRKIAWGVIASIWLLTGLSVWLLARSSYHIGASGLIYGFAGFLFFSGLFRGEFKSLMIAVAIAFLYGGMVYGVFPGQRGVSWESHLFGGISGLLTAYWFRNLGKETLNTSLTDNFRYQKPEGYNNPEGKRFKYTLRR